jgi:uncharacterized protein (DUF2141 family)
MKCMVVFLLILGTVIPSTFIFAQEACTVAGIVKFPERKGEIYVWLKTHDEFEKNQVPDSPARTLMIKPSPQQFEEKKAAFEFVSVPKGDYCIVCIQDLNRNGKLDFSESGIGFNKLPDEPFGFSGPVFPAHWDNLRFEVDKNIRGIEIHVLK